MYKSKLKVKNKKSMDENLYIIEHLINTWIHQN
jgi:hypothetical protein